MRDFFYPLFRNRPVPNYVEMERGGGSAKLIGSIKTARAVNLFSTSASLGYQKH
jgi:hypothetical protein